jgi:hypothetical protein
LSSKNCSTNDPRNSASPNWSHPPNRPASCNMKPTVHPPLSFSPNSRTYAKTFATEPPQEPMRGSPSTGKTWPSASNDWYSTRTETAHDQAVLSAHSGTGHRFHPRVRLAETGLIWHTQKPNPGA